MSEHGGGMEKIYLKLIKKFGVSEIINFRDKYNQLMTDSSNTQYTRNAESVKLIGMSTREKVQRVPKEQIGKSTSEKRKKDRKTLPPLLPMLIVNQEELSDAATSKNDLSLGKDAAFLFRIYPPFCYNMKTNHSKLSHHMEIVVLGNQTLDKLCDKIVCPEAVMEAGGDISEDPDTPLRPRLGEKYKSRMLYIGNTFYIDTSNEKNIDYSVSIRKWAKKEGLCFGDTLSMNESTCLDLKARIGYPYVYQHLGGCEHIIIIEYARLLEPKDCLESRYYPFYAYLRRTITKTCMACMELAGWIIYDSPRMVASTSFLCDTCFRSYHYIDGKKIGTFSAVRYFDCHIMPSLADFDNVVTQQSQHEDEEDMTEPYSSL